MGLASAAALVGGGISAFSSYSNMKSQISAAKQNAQLVQQQAQMNAKFAEMTAGAQASAIRGRAAYESQLLGMQADVSRRNATIAEQDAQIARESRRFRVQQLDRRNRRLAGSQHAAIAKAGVTVEGTPADVMFDSAMQGELEELVAIHIGDQEVRKHLIDAYNSNVSADMQDYNAGAVIHFGNQEASMKEWSGGMSAAMTLAQGNMQSSRYLSSIPTIRSQGYINMAGAALKTGASVYSIFNSPAPTISRANPSGYPQPSPGGPAGPAFGG